MSGRVNVRAAAGRALGATAVLGAVAACVEIATGPGGIDSIRIDSPSHAIIVGDTLRDSTGAVTRLHATAFGANGATVDDAPFRFVGLASSTDTTQKTGVLLVDSLTGLVRAPATRKTPFGRVAITVGGKLQIVDTITIVPRPTVLARVTRPDSLVASRLTFLCNQDVAARAEAILAGPVGGLADSSYVGNSLPFSTKVTGDSSGTALPVRGYYVRYDVIAPSADSIRTVTIGGVKRPAIGIIPDLLSDHTSPYDTTDATGVSTAALRVFPSALGDSVFKGPTIAVKVRAQARRSPKDTLPSVTFAFTLRRITGLGATPPSSCPAP